MTRLARSFIHLTIAFTLIVLGGCGGGGGSNSLTSGGGSNSGGGSTGGGSSPPLVITTTSLPDGVAGKLYSATMTASGGHPPYQWAGNGSLPGSLQIDGSTGNISGTYNVAGVAIAGITVTDSNNPPARVVTSLPIRFAAPLIISTASLSNAHINALYDIIIQAQGQVTNWSISSGQAPAGFQLSNPSSQMDPSGAITSQIELTGTATQTSTYNFTLQAQDGSNPPQVVTQAYTLVVDNHLAVATARLYDAFLQRRYDFQASAVNGTPPYQWSVVAPGLPSGLTINSSTGEITGFPTQPTFGYSVTLQVSDTSSPTQSDSKTLPFFVGFPLALSFPPGVKATINLPFSASLSAVGGKQPYAYSIVSGSLPPGISLTSQQYGTLAGTPTQLGTSSFTAQALDSSFPPQTAQAQIAITVSPPVLAALGTLPTRAIQGVAFDGVIAAIGGTPPYAWSIASGNLPPGLHLNGSNGEVSGTPNTLGTYDFNVQLTDSGSPQQVLTTRFEIVVAPALGRNDTIAKATPLGNGTASASISPYANPADVASPDTDYYRLIAVPGSVVQISIFAKRLSYTNPLDSVLELVDANGIRLTTCQQPDTTGNFTKGTFTDSCLNDDINPGISQDSELQFQVPGTTGVQTTFFAHVLDWRGDARPDMTYNIQVSGVVDPLTITTPVLPAGGVGINYNQNLAYSGGTGVVNWSLASGTLPPGVAVSAAGVLGGTPTAVGNYQFVLQATDGSTPQQTATKTFGITIEIPPIITSTSFPDAFTGVPYSQPVLYTGGTPPFYWSYPGDLPDMGVDPSGTLKGIPSTPGTFTGHVGILDALGLSDYRAFTITVRPGPLTLNSVVLSSGAVGSFYLDFLPASGGTPPYSWSVLSGALPAGLTLIANSQTVGEVTGTPTSSGTYTATIQVTDSGTPQEQSTGTVTITINP